MSEHRPRCPVCNEVLEDTAWGEERYGPYTMEQDVKYYCSVCECAWWYTVKYKVTEYIKK